MLRGLHFASRSPIIVLGDVFVSRSFYLDNYFREDALVLGPRDKSRPQRENLIRPLIEGYERDVQDLVNALKNIREEESLFIYHRLLRSVYDQDRPLYHFVTDKKCGYDLYPKID